MYICSLCLHSVYCVYYLLSSKATPSSARPSGIPWCNAGECGATCTESNSAPSPYRRVSVRTFSKRRERNEALINPLNRHYAAFTAIDRLTRASTGAVYTFYYLYSGLISHLCASQENGSRIESAPASRLLPDFRSGFSKVLKTLSAESTREELLAFLQQYGSHYVSEALYGSELSCSIYFPSKKVQQQLWLQYQKGERLSLHPNTQPVKGEQGFTGLSRNGGRNAPKVFIALRESTVQTWMSSHARKHRKCVQNVAEFPARKQQKAFEMHRYCEQMEQKRNPLQVSQNCESDRDVRGQHKDT